MSGLPTAARLLDLVMLGVIIEAVALVVYRRRTGRGMPVREVGSFLGAGLGLLLAARMTSPTTTSGSLAGFAAAMAFALVCHIWHVAQRWRV